ncbi:U-box domain-containing protein 9-like [Silene latifolia]|uniref:U-box domain-containing protein 9-like n=1 Tax=Silene latifolia TaxID=37657 RepID=UPI003D76C331
MAKREIMACFDDQVSDKANIQKIKELKKELQRLAMEIIEDNQDNDGVITINKAIQTLIALKDLNLNNNHNKNPSLSSSFDHLDVPDEFRCPISREIMKDPVVLATGQTYDRPFIYKWLKDGHRTCPQTQQVLSHTVLTPNHLVQELIAQWCKDHGIQLPPPVKDLDDGVITDADRHHLNSLLDKLSSTLSEQKQAAREIRLLTKRMPSFRSFFGESNDAIPQLLNPLSLSEKPDDHPDLQEDLVTVILNLSIHDNNKQVIGEHPLVIPVLVESLKRGTIDTRSNAAAALFTLSALDSNKVLIGKSSALRPLIDLLEEGHPLAMKDAASAIFNLCVVVENRGRAVRDGAVRVILKKIMDGILVDELLSILAILATHQIAVEELGELGAVNCLLGIIRGSTCERNKENCIAILYSICINNRTKLKEVRDEEKAYCTISKLSEHGTSRAKRKANSLLDRLYRGINLTNTA